MLLNEKIKGCVSRIEAAPIFSSKVSALMLPLQGKGRQSGGKGRGEKVLVKEAEGTS